MEKLIGLKEAAVRLGVSSEAVRRLCHRGTMAHVRIAGRLFVRIEEVDRRAKEAGSGR